MKEFRQRLFRTGNDSAALVLRVFLAIVVFPHGAQKLFGWFGGFGFSASMAYFTDTMGLPWLIAFLVILLESLGAAVLIAGLATRAVALAYCILALGIVFSGHLQHGFFMNWFGQQAGEGFEYFLLWIGMALALMVSGGGRLSIDRRFFPAEHLQHEPREVAAERPAVKHG